MLQFGSKHVCIEDVYIFKHCREMTLFLLWIETYCISCVVQQTSGEKDLSSLVRDDDSSLAAIRHVQSIIPVVRPRPNIRSHSVLLTLYSFGRSNLSVVTVDFILFYFIVAFFFSNKLFWKILESFSFLPLTAPSCYTYKTFWINALKGNAHLREWTFENF